MRIDAHHHFWDPARYDYPWMVGPALDPVRRAFGPADLAPELSRAGIDGTVLVQTISSEDETRDFLRVAEATDFVLGVVGWVDLTANDVGDRLDALTEAEGGSWLVGIRHQVHDEPDQQWLSRSEVRRGLRALVERNLTYDLLLRAREIPAAIETVRAVPELRFVVDHIAKPTIAAGQDAPWASGMAQLSELPNVCVKLSGMVTEADWATWTPENLRPFVEQVRDWFGGARLMAGSDWPVCLLAAESYTQVFDATRAALAGLSEDEARDVFGGNAQAFYGLATRKEEVPA
jgi:L-fucono-1,5-lactonase